MSIKRIIVINNSYHAELFKSQALIDNEAIVYCNSEVALNMKCKVREIPQQISLKHSKFNRLRSIKSVRKLILSETQDYCIDSIILGSDKELFNQILMSTYPDAYVRLFDEGIGLYRSIQKWTRLKNFLYTKLSTLLVGIKIEFVQPLGSHSLVNEINIRRHGLLGYVRADVRYRDLCVPAAVVPLIDLKNSILVLLPWDLNDQRLVSKVVKTITFILKNSYLKIQLKPHPSDDMDWSKMSFFPYNHRLTILEGASRAELLSFDSYRFVVNFRSSSVLDYLFNGGLNYIITISLDSGHTTDAIYPNLCYYNDTRSIEQNLKLANENYYEII